jgi:ferric-dicitrate binding protein FerR (iron transport regulator)
MNPPLHIRELLFRYNWNELKPKDERRLLRWRGRSPANELYFQQETGATQRKAVAERAEAASGRSYALIMNRWKGREARHRGVRILMQNKWWRLAAVVVVSTGLYYLMNVDISIAPSPPEPAQTGKQPAGSSIIDNNGPTHPIEDIRNGFNDGYRAARERRKKRKKFSLFIAPASKPQGSADDYSTLSTSDHDRYLLLLPDGSRTWQNINSSVAYPANYSADALKLRVSGEVYLEITPNKADRTPFLVQAGAVQIEAHTGRFNLRAYPGEPEITVTAIDGGLSVRTGSSGHPDPVLLSPGEQLVVRGNEVEIKKSVDLAKVLHWKKEF